MNSVTPLSNDPDQDIAPLSPFGDVVFTHDQHSIDDVCSEYTEITEINNNQDYETVRQALSELRGIRSVTEDERKKMKADSLSYGKLVDSEAKRLVALVSPHEVRLKDLKDVVDAEKAQVKADKAAKEKTRIEGHMSVVARIEASVNLIETMNIPQLEIEIAAVAEIKTDQLEEYSIRAKTKRSTMLELLNDQLTALLQEKVAAEETKRIEGIRRNILTIIDGPKEVEKLTSLQLKGIMEKARTRDLTVYMEFQQEAQEALDTSFNRLSIILANKLNEEAQEVADKQRREEIAAEETARLETLAEDNRIEAERLAKEKREIAEQKAKLDARQEKEDLEKIAADNKLEAERLAKEAETRRKKQEADLEAERLALEPDQDKLTAFAGSLANTKLPNVTTEKGRAITARAQELLELISIYIFDSLD